MNTAIIVQQQCTEFWNGAGNLQACVRETPIYGYCCCLVLYQTM